MCPSRIVYPDRDAALQSNYLPFVTLVCYMLLYVLMRRKLISTPTATHATEDFVFRTAAPLVPLKTWVPETTNGSIQNPGGKDDVDMLLF